MGSFLHTGIAIWTTQNDKQSGSANPIFYLFRQFLSLLRWHDQLWKYRLNLGATYFEPGGEDEVFAEVLGVFVDAEAGAVGGEFEENAAGFSEVDRLEPEAVD